MAETKATELNAEAFRAHLNDTFHFAVGEGDQTIPCELIEVSSLASDTKREDRHPFSLLFRGPADVAFEQGTFGVSQEAMGEMHIFVVTVGPDPDSEGMLHEAVFT